MNTTEENGRRQKERGTLKQRFARLTKDDHLYEEGQKQEEFGNLQIRIGNTENDLFKIIDKL